MSMERLTHEADFGLEDWEETLFFVKSDPNGAYNILDIAKYHGENEFDEILKNIVLRLSEIENILGDTYDLDRLRELVEADKAGRCVLHPLKAEDEVYIAILGRVLPFEVTNAVWYGASPTYKAMHGTHLCFAFEQDDIGKTVFLTREAAEAALAKEDYHE